MHHYTYIVEHGEHGFYVGKRSSRVLPDNDPYMGSGSKLKRLMKQDPTGWSKTVLLEFDSAEAALHHEKSIVTDDLLRHPRCLNLIRGGVRDMTGFLHSEDTLRHMRETRKGRKHTEEAKTKMRAVALARAKFSDAHRANIAKARTGQTASEAARAKMSSSGLGKPKPPGHSEKLRELAKRRFRVYRDDGSWTWGYRDPT